jgi:hypothetical protein
LLIGTSQGGSSCEQQEDEQGANHRWRRRSLFRDCFLHIVAHREGRHPLPFPKPLSR